MSSDVSQSILRLTLLASATAAFMVVWAGDNASTVGMTLAERNSRIVPAHAIGRRNGETQLARRSLLPAKPARSIAPATTVSAVRPSSRVDLALDLQSLPAGTYRVVFTDGRVEWLTVIDRAGSSPVDQPAVVTTTVNGQAAHLIRVTERPQGDALVR